MAWVMLMELGNELPNSKFIVLITQQAKL